MKTRPPSSGRDSPATGSLLELANCQTLIARDLDFETAGKNNAPTKPTNAAATPASNHPANYAPHPSGPTCFNPPLPFPLRPGNFLRPLRLEILQELPPPRLAQPH